MAASKIDGDLQVTGRITMGSTNLPANCVYDAQIPSDADIDPTKMVRNRHVITLVPGKVSVDAADGIYVVHTYTKAGKIIAFQAGLSTDPVGDDVVEFDLLVAAAGAALATALSGGTEVAITSTTGNNTVVAGVIDPAKVDRAAGDVLAIEVDAIHATGTMGIGPFATVIIEEEP